MNVWVNAITNSGCNVRSIASTDGRVVRSVTAQGEVARLTNAIAADDGIWNALTFANGVSGYIRTDVHETAELRPSVRLDVPYRSQNASDAKRYFNDCGYATLAMLMEYGGLSVSVDDLAKAGGMITDTVQPFWRIIQAAKAYGFEAAARQGTQITDIIKSLHDGYPIGMLVNYEHLRPTEKYGHFVVVVGYSFDGATLSLIIHDPYGNANTAYPGAIFARAIGDMVSPSTKRKLNNYEFQALVITQWPKPVAEPQPTEPPPSGDNSPALMTIRNHAAEIVWIIDTIEG